MSATRFFAPDSLEDALRLLAEYRGGAVVVNGGTDIVEKIAFDRIRPEAVVYIGNIRSLCDVERRAGYTVIGGGVVYADILRSPLCAPLDALRDAIAEIGSPPIRAVATLAGNIGSAVPAADGNVALVALGALVELVSLEGERSVPVCDVFLGPGRTCLKPHELIRGIVIPDRGHHSAFVKLARRKSQDIAQVSAAVRLDMDGDVCRDVVIGMGAVSATVVRAKSFEILLRGLPIEEGLAQLRGAVPTEASLRSPRNRTYKEAVMGVIGERAVRKALGRRSSCL